MIMAKYDENDLGLPESPIYSNFSNRLWKRHARHGLVQSPNRSHGNTDGHRSLQVEPSPVEGNPRAAANLTNAQKNGDG